MDCATCARDDLAVIEAEGRKALAGERSWSSLSEQFGLTRQSVRNHMEKHFVAPPSATEQALEGFDALVAETVEELTSQMRLAPPEAKALYAVAIQNLLHVHETKPSQQNLIASLKAISELTGMKLEQRLMLSYAKAQFGRLAPAAPLPALETGDVIEVDSEEV